MSPSTMRKWPTLRLLNRKIQLWEGSWRRFVRFLDRRRMLLKLPQTFYGDDVRGRQPPDAVDHIRVLFQNMLRWAGNRMQLNAPEFFFFFP